MLDDNALHYKAPPTFCFVSLRCRIFFSLRRRCRHDEFWKCLRGVLSTEGRLVANMCQQRMERNQLEDIGGSEKKDISRKQGCARISQHKLHHTHVSLFFHRTKSAFCSKNSNMFKEHSHLYESSNASKCFFQTPHTLQVKKRAIHELGCCA